MEGSEERASKKVKVDHIAEFDKAAIDMGHDWFEDLESSIIAVIFQIGLTQSSPKAIIGLMPETDELTREHVKSHLQKYRIQPDKSKDQFAAYFETYLKPEFRAFMQSQEHMLNSGSSMGGNALECQHVANGIGEENGEVDPQERIEELQVELESAHRDSGQLRKSLSETVMQSSKIWHSKLDPHLTNP